MIKYIILLLISFNSFSQAKDTLEFKVNNYSNENIDSLKFFLNEIIDNKNFTSEDIDPYMSNEYLKDSKKLKTEKKKIHLEYLDYFINDIRTKLDNNNYKILNSSKTKYNIIYNGDGKVYILLDENNKLLTVFIVENNKIISFCTDIYNTKNEKIVPYYFFDQYVIP